MGKNPTFALKEIVKDKLFSLEKGNSDAFRDCFKKWADPSYLYGYFLEHTEVLIYHKTNVKEATKRLIKEASDFEQDILKYANGTIQGKGLDDYIFVPLHSRDDIDMPLLQSKAYGYDNGKSFLRLYGIRLSDGSYIVAGGLIKSSQALQETKEGRKILKILRELQTFLESEGYEDAFDIQVLIIPLS